MARSHAHAAGPGLEQGTSGAVGCRLCMNAWLFFPLLLRAKVTEFSFTPCAMYAGCTTNALKCCWIKGFLCIEGIKLLYSTVVCVFTLGPEHPARVTGASNLPVHVVTRTTKCWDPGSCLMNPAQGFSLMALLQIPVRGTSSSLMQWCLGKDLCLEKSCRGIPSQIFPRLPLVPAAHLVLQILLRLNNNFKVVEEFCLNECS